MSLQIPSDASANVQAALRELDTKLERIAAKSSGISREEFESLKKEIQDQFTQTGKKATHLDFRDVFRGGEAHALGYVPDPGPGPSDGEHVLTSTGYWGPILGGAIRLAEAGEGGRSMAQRVVNVLASLAVLNGLSADSIRSRVATVISKLDAPAIGVRAYNSGNITANAVDTTLITYDSENWDTAGFHASGSGRLIVPAGYNGLYRVTGRARWAATTTAGYRTLYLSKNGGDVFATGECIAISTIPAVESNVLFDQEISATVRLDTTGDYAEMFVGTSENSTITYIDLLYDSPSLEMHRVGV